MGAYIYHEVTLCLLSLLYRTCFFPLIITGDLLAYQCLIFGRQQYNSDQIRTSESLGQELLIHQVAHNFKKAMYDTKLLALPLVI